MTTDILDFQAKTLEIMKENDVDNENNQQNLKKIDKNSDNFSDLKFEMQKIRILELSNAIDLWEKENLLNSANGFYSLNGKAAIDKGEKYLRALNDFIDKEIQKIGFESDFERKIAENVKNKKIATISKGIFAHSANEMQEWFFETLDIAQKTAIEKGIAYRNDDEGLNISFQNGLFAVNKKAEILNYDKNETKLAISNFKNSFHCAILEAMADENNVRIFVYFKMFKMN